MAWLFAIPAVVAVPFAGLVTLATAINQRWRLIPAVEDVDRNSYGTTAYGLSITALMLLFWTQQPDAVCAGVLVMACGDGLAGLVGRSIASPQWSVMGQTKSLVGTTTMLAVSFTVLLALGEQRQHRRQCRRRLADRGGGHWPRTDQSCRHRQPQRSHHSGVPLDRGGQLRRNIVSQWRCQSPRLPRAATTSNCSGPSDS